MSPLCKRVVKELQSLLGIYNNPPISLCYCSVYLITGLDTLSGSYAATEQAGNSLNTINVLPLGRFLLFYQCRKLSYSGGHVIKSFL